MAIIEVNNLVKEYRLGQLKGLKQSATNALSRVMGKQVEKRPPFKALDGISFQIERSEVVGIIGTNGAGKSTLLKILGRICTPTRGSVKVKGTVAPLIEVGAGLVGDLTGRENIYLNGTILGIPKETIRKKFDEIVSFAELEEFIDTPIKRYSSGMAVRLGFSIATSVDTDILIVDEVLAVGDLAFQRKCFDRMEEMIKRQGKTVLLVSHNIRQVERLCTRVFLLDSGRVLMEGGPAEVCNLFYDRSNKKTLNRVTKKTLSSQVLDSGEVEIEEILLFNGNSVSPSDEVEMHDSFRIGVRFKAKSDIPSPEIIVGFHTIDFVYIAQTSSATLPDRPDIAAGEHYFECILTDMQLMPGIYCIRLAFVDKYRRVIWCGENLKTFKVNGNNFDISKMPELGLVDLPFAWDFSTMYNGAGMERINVSNEKLVLK